MIRFVARHGERILLVALGLFVTVAVYTALVLASRAGLLPHSTSSVIVASFAWLVSVFDWVWETAERRPHHLGAIAQVVSAAVAIAAGLALMRRWLPTRLKEFIDEELIVVVDASNRLIADQRLQAATVPNSSVPRKNRPLFHAGPVRRAIDGIARIPPQTKGFRRPLFLFGTRTSADPMSQINAAIDLTKKRLDALQLSRDYAQLIRAIELFAEADMAMDEDKKTKSLARAAELLDAAVESPHTRRVALEIRGTHYLRSDDHERAMHDFDAAMDVLRIKPANSIDAVRLQRLKATALARKGHRSNIGARFNEARRLLEDASRELAKSTRSEEEQRELREVGTVLSNVKQELNRRRQRAQTQRNDTSEMQ
jgi:hypothetical protein